MLNLNEKFCSCQVLFAKFPPSRFKSYFLFDYSQNFPLSFSLVQLIPQNFFLLLAPFGDEFSLFLFRNSNPPFFPQPFPSFSIPTPLSLSSPLLFSKYTWFSATIPHTSSKSAGAGFKNFKGLVQNYFLANLEVFYWNLFVLLSVILSVWQ